MNFRLETPRAVIEAREAQKGWNWFVELLVFVLVFIVVSIGETLVLLPVELVMMFTDAEYMSAVAAGDATLIMEAANRIASSDGMLIGMLFANIAIIGIVMLFCKVIQKRKMRTIGFVKKDIAKEYGIGLLVGFGIFTVAVLLCVVTGSLKLSGLSSTFSVVPFVLFGLGYMIQGMAEEVLCRGYLMVSIGRRYPIWAAVLLNALFFAALHLANDGISPLALVNLVLFGVFASVYFIKRGSIWGIGAVHSIWNFVQGNFYGIKVSGISSSCSVLESVSVEGGELVNGGAFGLEGGLAVTIVLVLGILFLLTRPAKDAVEEVQENVHLETAEEETAV
ncbi:MAG: lysostaphin resistance A-like protein [Agathobacter sp.]